MVRRLAFWLLPVGLAAASVPAATIERIGDGYRLANARVAATVSPRDGGRIVDLFDRRTGRRLARLFPGQQAPAGSGALADRLWPARGDAIRRYERSEYRVVGASAGGARAELTLRCDAPPLTIEKRIILDDDARGIRVRYALSNPTEQDFVGRFWSCSVLTPPGPRWKIRLPTGRTGDSPECTGEPRENLVEHALDSPCLGNHFVADCRQDFAAVYDASGGAGAAVVAPFELLDCFYCHVPQAGGPQLPTLEWMTPQLLVRPLAKGRADAPNHPELADPLQDYVVRFEMGIDLFDSFDFAGYRPPPPAAKQTRFAPVLEAPAVHFEGFPPAAPLYAGQRERPLVVTACSAALSAEFFEFTRRFNCDYAAVEGWGMESGGYDGYNGWDIPDPEAMLARQLDRVPQVVILPGTLSEALPAKLRSRLLSLVESGRTAVVYVSDQVRFPELMPGDGRPVGPGLLRGIPLQVEVREYAVGKGRTYWVPFRLHRNGCFWSQNDLMLPVPESRDRPSPECYYAFYGRLIRRALGYPCPARILEAKPGERGLEVAVQADRAMRARLGTPGDSREFRLKAGENRVVLPLARDGLNGLHDLFLGLEVDGHTVDVFIAQVLVRRSAWLEGLSSRRYAHEPGDPVEGTVSVQGKPADLHLSLADAVGRILAEQDFPQANGRVQFSLRPQLDGVNSFLRLAAELRRDGRLLETRSVPLSRRTPDNPSRLRFVLWDVMHTSPSDDLRHRSMARIGFTHVLGEGSGAMSPFDARFGAEKLLALGVRYMANGIWRFNQWDIDRKSNVRRPCLRDPEGIEEVRRGARRNLAKHAANFPVFYYTADENSLGMHDQPHDFCRSRSCLEAFRTRMRRKYGSLEHLNRNWRTSFADWARVEPPTLDEARRTGVFTGWMEHRRFMLEALPLGVRAVEEEIRKQDPQARLAHSGQGLTGVNDLWDWRVLLKSYSLSGLYGRDGGLPDLVRSLKPGHPAGMWNGYGAPLPSIRSNCWNDLANGLFAPAYWCDRYFYRRGDAGLNAAGLHMQRLITEVEASGLDPLFTEGARVESPFTIVYSPESLIAAVSTGSDSVVNADAYTADFDGWTQMLRAAGYPAPRVVDAARLASADPAAHPALVLPLMQMMTDQDIARVRDYVRRGGLLVVDAQAGILDDFGMPRGEGNPMLELAGIRAERATGTGAGGLRFRGRMVRLTPIGAVARPTAARALGAVVVGTPPADFQGIGLGGVDREISGAFFVNRFGKGRVVYLNGILDGYVLNQGDLRATRPLLEAFRELFSGLGIPPRQAASPGVNSAEYRWGPFRTFLFVRRSGEGTVDIDHPLGESMHLYDTLRHRHLGRRSRIRGSLGEHQVRMLAASVRPLGPMKCRASFDGRFVALEASQDPGAAIRIGILHDGEPVRPLALGTAFEKAGSWRFDLGLRPAGEWRLEVLNALTGERYGCRLR